MILWNKFFIFRIDFGILINIFHIKIQSRKKNKGKKCNFILNLISTLSNAIYFLKRSLKHFDFGVNKLIVDWRLQKRPINLYLQMIKQQNLTFST